MSEICCDAYVLSEWLLKIMALIFLCKINEPLPIPVSGMPVFFKK